MLPHFPKRCGELENKRFIGDSHSYLNGLIEATPKIFQDKFLSLSGSFLAGGESICCWLRRRCFEFRKATMNYE